ncbi:MAG: hypothetical protein M1117_02590 [Candidatus Thermoplasmatota archaeon]|uniref:Uncharacterized protein n=3 Tax=Candidatus Sysuiplasma superficiale TaxID=2823368 RepID=A0A8J7YMZ5_9ARCH|nr:hypothetical protein [Candidatus Sysuiplasma superficiale]MCL4346791.1 hypothetical protein [Candidatus Thermoplasmatota archaeon]
MVGIKRISGNREGVAGAIATIFILLIVISFINLYLVGYVPVYMKSQEYSHMQELYGQFSSLQIQSYNLESGKWHYPLTTTLVLGTQGAAPFASPTQGQLSFSPSAFSMSISYPLGLPLAMPTCQHDFYENFTGTSSNKVGIHATFSPDKNNSFYSVQGSGPANSENPIYYVPQNSSVCYIINSSWVQSDDFDVFVGGNGGPVLNNFTLMVFLYGNNDIIDFTGQGSNQTIWYVSYGAYNQVFDGNNPCGFQFNGKNDKGYIQDYGAHDTAPFGWPQFQTVEQYDTVSGSLAAQVSNRYYTPQSVIYQGGGIILAQGGQSYFLNGPEIKAVNSSSSGASVTLNLVSLIGQNFSAAGNGPVSLSTSYFSNNSVVVGQYRGLNRINVLDLTIRSDYALAWASYLQHSLSSLQNVTEDPGIAFVGNGCIDMSGGGGPAPNPPPPGGGPSPPGGGSGGMHYVTWGAYSLTVSNNTVELTLFNIAFLSLEVGTLQTSVY